MINLFDTYEQRTRDLHYSLKQAGYDFPTIVINDEGFLPEDVISPFGYYTKMAQRQGEPLYFDQLEVPDFWEIRGDATQAAVYDESYKRANIIYEDTKQNQRIVQRVEWLGLDGGVRSVDHYNQSGWRYAQTNYNANHQPVMTSYYDADDHEVIVENYVTSNIILNREDKIYFFKSRIDFVTEFLTHEFGTIDGLIYNSLATPFLVSYQLDQPGRDILFWQETLPENGEIPGNMTTLIAQNGRTKNIVFQNKTDFERDNIQQLQQQIAIDYIGYNYPIVKHRNKKNEAFILTNTDQIAHVAEIVAATPNVHFNVAAFTEMSTKLMSLGDYKNVSLYPNVTFQRVEKLFKQSVLYLDINGSNEVMSAIRQAYLDNAVIMAFEQTKHNPHFTLDALTFDEAQPEQLIDTLHRLCDEPEYLADMLDAQHAAAGQSSPADYRALLAHMTTGPVA